MVGITEIIDRQIAAFNSRDIEAFVACYRPDAKVVQPDGSTLAAGHLQIRQQYGELFSRSPDLKAEVSNRIEVDLVVVDEERITGFNLPGYPTELHSVVAYRVRENLIESAQLLA